MEGLWDINSEKNQKVGLMNGQGERLNLKPPLTSNLELAFTRRSED